MRAYSTIAIIIALIVCVSWSSSAYAEQLNFPASSKYGGKPVTLSGEFKSGGSKKPLVILLHGCRGLEGAVRASLRSHASMVRRAGFSTLILDSFTPRGVSGGWVCDRISRLASAQAYRQRDVKDAIRYLSSTNQIDPDNVFVMGQSNGGSVASLIAQRPPTRGIRAAVAFYPWCGAVPINPRVPLLVLSGEDDRWTPPDECKKIDKAGGNLTVVTYPDTVHSFDLKIAVQSYKGHKVGGNPKSHRDAKSRMLKFFRANVK